MKTYDAHIKRRVCQSPCSFILHLYTCLEQKRLSLSIKVFLFSLFFSREDIYLSYCIKETCRYMESVYVDTFPLSLFSFLSRIAGIFGTFLVTETKTDKRKKVPRNIGQRKAKILLLLQAQGTLDLKQWGEMCHCIFIIYMSLLPF